MSNVVRINKVENAPSRLWELGRDLKAAERLVLHYIDFSVDFGVTACKVFSQSARMISEKTGLSERTIQRSLSNLAKKGFIKKLEKEELEKLDAMDRTSIYELMV